MSAGLTIRENGFVEFAYSKTPAWHGLGQELPENASIEEWVKLAGMDWEIFESPITYHCFNDELKLEDRIFPEKKILFRSDNKMPLSIVGEDYKVVQPREIIEFFNDLMQIHNFKLSVAGTLFGGKRFWALAETGFSETLLKKDIVKGHLLLVTSADGTLSTIATFVATRVVCNNTLRIALQEKNKGLVKCTHKREWDAQETKINLGLLDKSWVEFKNNLHKLSSIEVNDNFAKDFFVNLVSNEKSNPEKGVVAKKVDKLMHLYKNGTGADMSYGTAWGVLNAVTEEYTHNSGRRAQSNHFWDANFGKYEKIKEQAYNELVELYK